MRTFAKYLFYFVAGTYLGFVFMRGEVISWFRIQEMFRFQSFHMYGVIMSAVLTGAASIFLLRALGNRDVAGQSLDLTQKNFTKGTVIGSVFFGFGWAFTGACPGPLYTLVGAGQWIILVPLAAAVLGAYTYGVLKPKLPH